MYKKLITVNLVLFYIFSAFAQSREDKWPTFISLDSLASSRTFKVWELHPMDSSNVYFCSISIRNKEFSKRDRKTYIKLIRESRKNKPKDLYLIFELGKIYKIDTLRSDILPATNDLLIEEVNLDYYRNPQGLTNLKVNKQLLKRRFMIFKYKKIDPMSIK